jgi:hypothetical protein
MPRKTAATARAGDAVQVNGSDETPQNGAVADDDILADDDIPSREVLLPLSHTRPGKFARVRRLDLMTLITISSPSPTLQSVVLEVFGNVQQNPETESPVAGTILEQIG